VSPAGSDSAPAPAARFDQYHSDLAERMVASGAAEGLPGYLGVRTVDVGPGTMTAELDVRAELLNPFGTLHGGVVTALADHVLGAVLYPVIPKGAWAATTQINLNFTARVSEGTLSAEAVIVALSRRTAVVRIDLHNEGRLVAAAQGTVTIATPSGPGERR
jgi:1,4-dihydroxy-2-naphthoyl-CoA hydrolase